MQFCILHKFVYDIPLQFCGIVNEKRLRFFSHEMIFQYLFFLIIIGESLSVDPIKNSLKLFEKWNVLECYMQENIKIFYLKEDYDKEVIAKGVYDTIAAFKWTRNVN